MQPEGISYYTGDSATKVVNGEPKSFANINNLIYQIKQDYANLKS
jgi:hypothetical protein